MNHVKDIDTADFARDVLERSQDVPVVVDFWAEWCGPCKVLGPTLEQAAADYGGSFELAKLDVDRNQQLAAQFGVQGIPTVIVFKDGKPAARFTGALPEPAVRQWIDGILPTEVDLAAGRARAAAQAGDTATAERLYRETLAEQPDHQDAGTGLADLLLGKGVTGEALQILAKLAPTAEVERLQAVARVAAGSDTNAAELETRVADDPGDEEARIALAGALAADGDYESALDHLLDVVTAKGAAGDDARKAMLDIFEVLGPEHDLTGSYRQRLASALF